MEKLESMKYSELQKLAKKLGIKANQKADKIITALKELSNVSFSDTSITQSSDKECLSATTDNEQEQSTATKQPTKNISRRKTTKGRRQQLPSDSEELTTEDECQDRRKSFTIPTPTVTKQSTVTATPKLSSTEKLPKARTSTPRVVQVPSAKRNSLKRLGSSAKGSSAKRSSSGSRNSFTRTPKSGLPKPQIKRKVSNPIKGRNLTSSTSSAPTESGDDERAPPPTNQTFTMAAPSSSVRDLLDSMKPGMSDEERMDSLKAALSKNVEKDLQGQKNTAASNIPRYTGKGKVEGPSGSSKKVTPAKDWSKIHQRQWDKMESLSEYLEKKRKRTESMSQSVKKLKMKADQMQANMKKLKTPLAQQKPQSPAKANTFKPIITSTSKLNLNFGAGHHSAFRGVKGSPAVARRHSPRLGDTKSFTIPEKPLFTIGKSATKENTAVKKVVPKKVAPKKSVASPFRAKNLKASEEIDSEVSFSNKKKFDIKESLSRPVSYTPHKGKLKPFAPIKPFSHQVEVKEVKVKTRDDRRVENAKRRTDKRRDAQMSRRGINV